MHLHWHTQVEDKHAIAIIDILSDELNAIADCLLWYSDGYVGHVCSSVHYNEHGCLASNIVDLGLVVVTSEQSRILP